MLIYWKLPAFRVIEFHFTRKLHTISVFDGIAAAAFLEMDSARDGLIALLNLEDLQNHLWLFTCQEMHADMLLSTSSSMVVMACFDRVLRRFPDQLRHLSEKQV